MVNEWVDWGREEQAEERDDGRWASASDVVSSPSPLGLRDGLDTARGSRVLYAGDGFVSIAPLCSTGSDGRHEVWTLSSTRWLRARFTQPVSSSRPQPRPRALCFMRPRMKLTHSLASS